MLRLFSKQKKAITVIAVFSIAILLVSLLAHADSDNRKNLAQALLQQKTACQLAPQDFLNTVNGWRAAKGVAPLMYSDVLQTAATDHMNDMIKYSYYGHTNPSTQVVWYDQLYKQYVPAAHQTSEVLSGESDSQKELVGLKNSPEHFEALTSATYKYFGSYAVYHPQSWAVYDNAGNQTDPAGKYHTECLVLGELSDTTSASPTLAATSVKTPTPSGAGCSEVTLYKSTKYVDSSLLPKGQQQVYTTGYNGSQQICNGKVVSTMQPVDQVIHIGTGAQVSSPTHTSPPLQQYVPTSPPHDHAWCVQSVVAQTHGASVEADQICTNQGY